jgi:hypothetical protein
MQHIVVLIFAITIYSNIFQDIAKELVEVKDSKKFIGK